MKPTKLEWEDVIQFEEVEGYGKEVWKHNNQYYIVNIEGGMMDNRVVYELPDELFALLESGERTLREVSYRVKHDFWPPTEEERKESRKKFISKYPASLIDVPENRKLFSREELERLIPLAEKVWIESEGRLPWNYVSPLEKGE
ncbi:hypothetical protein O3796_05385 [Granulicatella adiacens]|uniref:hypothetical protein n=1 Tax=Granulicatella adiacens TaxID=46124 RepID=UPI00352BE0BC